MSKAPTNAELDLIRFEKARSLRVDLTSDRRITPLAWVPPISRNTVRHCKRKGVVAR